MHGVARRWSSTPAAMSCARQRHDRSRSPAAGAVRARPRAGRSVARRRGRAPRCVARAFGARHADESHRARLRVEIGRLRAELRPLAEHQRDASAVSRWRRAGPREVVVLARPVEERHAARARLPGRRRSVVELGAGAGARRQPAQRAAGARRAGGGRQGAVVRPRPGAALDDAAAAGIHDDLVTPGAAAGWLGRSVTR